VTLPESVENLNVLQLLLVLLGENDLVFTPLPGCGCAGLAMMPSIKQSGNAGAGLLQENLT
jgi:hypothetical protein